MSTTYSSQGLLEIQSSGPTKLYNFKNDDAVTITKEGKSLSVSPYYFGTVKGNVKVRSEYIGFLLLSLFLFSLLTFRCAKVGGSMKSKSLTLMLMDVR